MESRAGWHFLPENGKLSYSDGRAPHLGERLAMLHAYARPKLCVQGMHASDTPYQASGYGTGPLLCRVLVEGNLDIDEDKFCGRYRTIVAGPVDIRPWIESEKAGLDIPEKPDGHDRMIVSGGCRLCDWLGIWGWTENESIWSFFNILVDQGREDEITDRFYREWEQQRGR